MGSGSSLKLLFKFFLSSFDYSSAYFLSCDNFVFFNARPMTSMFKAWFCLAVKVAGGGGKEWMSKVVVPSLVISTLNSWWIVNCGLLEMSFSKMCLYFVSCRVDCPSLLLDGCEKGSARGLH